MHGKDEYLHAIQVLAPRFRFLVLFFPENENAGGSAICIHRDVLRDDALVTHAVTSQGRDHLVTIRSGRHNLVNVNVHFEPELSLRQLRDRLHLINTRTGLLIPMEWALFWVTSTSVIQKKDDFGSGTRHSPMVTRERLQRFHSFFFFFFPHVLEIAQPDYTRRDSTALGIIRTLSRIDRIFVNLPMAEARDFHCNSHVFENLGGRSIPSDHAAVRLVIQKPSNRGQQCKRIPSWMSRHSVFCSLLQPPRLRTSSNPLERGLPLCSRLDRNGLIP